MLDDAGIDLAGQQRHHFVADAVALVDVQRVRLVVYPAPALGAEKIAQFLAAERKQRPDINVALFRHPRHAPKPAAAGQIHERVLGQVVARMPQRHQATAESLRRLFVELVAKPTPRRFLGFAFA